MALRILPLLALAVLVPACSPPSSPETLPAPDLTEGLKELAEVYKYRATQHMTADEFTSAKR